MKVFITGRPGAGKTTAIRELQKRGFTAYNTDELEGVTRLEDAETGQPVDWPVGPVDWTKYRWNWQAELLQKLLDSDDLVFVGAVVGNQEEFYNLFDHIIVLTLDTKTLAKRLSQHEHNRHPDENARIAMNHERKQQIFLDTEGVISISSTQPVEKIVDDILMSVRI